MLRLTCLVLLVISLTVSASAMIQSLPFAELVKAADVIVIAKVTDKAAAKDAKLLNTLSLEKALKGEWAADKPLEIFTPDLKGKRVEDVVLFPDKGQRVVLFLKKGKDGTVLIVNGIQGVWPLEEKTNKTLGMGFRYSLEKIEALVKGAPGK